MTQAFKFVVGNVHEVQGEIVRVQFPQALVHIYDIPRPVIVSMLCAVVSKGLADALGAFRDASGVGVIGLRQFCFDRIQIA